MTESGEREVEAHHKGFFGRRPLQERLPGGDRLSWEHVDDSDPARSPHVKRMKHDVGDTIQGVTLRRDAYGRLAGGVTRRGNDSNAWQDLFFTPDEADVFLQHRKIATSTTKDDLSAVLGQLPLCLTASPEVPLSLRDDPLGHRKTAAALVVGIATQMVGMGVSDQN